MDFCIAQYNVAPNEITTPGYWLWNSGISASVNTGSNVFELAITANNMMNTSYYDNLSRFKNYGLLNIGRNIVIMLKIKFVSEQKKK